MLRRGVDATPPEGAPRGSYDPPPPDSPSSPHPREAAVRDPKETALLIIDAQNYNCTRAGALWNGEGNARRAGGAEEELEYFFSRLQGGDESDKDNNPGVIRNWVKLAAAARRAGSRVAFTGERSFD